jgi:hypothetical protein
MTGPSLGAFTRPTRAEAAELRRRFEPGELVDLAGRPSLWNVTLTGLRHGDVVLESHRNDPPPPAEWPRERLRLELRRAARRVLAAPACRRDQALAGARADLEALAVRGLWSHEIDNWNWWLLKKIEQAEEAAT